MRRLAKCGCHPQPCGSRRPGGSPAQRDNSWLRFWDRPRTRTNAWHGSNMSCQPSVRRVRETPRGDALQLATEFQALFGQSVSAEPTPAPSPAQRKCLINECEHCAGQASSPADRGLQQSLAATLQAPHALLMPGAGESVVNAPAVMDQHSRPILSQQLLGGLGTASRIDHITSGTRADEGVQPSIAAFDAPSRLVGCDLRRAAKVLAKLLVSRPATLGRTPDRADAGGTRERQLLEQCGQQLHALAMRQAQLLIE